MSCRAMLGARPTGKRTSDSRQGKSTTRGETLPTVGLYYHAPLDFEIYVTLLPPRALVGLYYHAPWDSTTTRRWTLKFFFTLLARGLVRLYHHAPLDFKIFRLYAHASSTLGVPFCPV